MERVPKIIQRLGEFYKFKVEDHVEINQALKLTKSFKPKKIKADKNQE
jgi:hypothetical protein